MQKKILFLVLLIFSFSCNIIKTIRRNLKVQNVKTIKLQDSIKFTEYFLFNNHINVKTTLKFGKNESDTISAILDTGAPTIISNELATLHKLMYKRGKIKKSKINNAGKMSEEFSILKSIEINLNNSSFVNKYWTGKSENYLLKLNTCDSVKAIIGSDIFGQGLLIINGKEKKYAIVNHKFNQMFDNRSYKKNSISFVGIQNTPMVDINFAEKIKGKAMIDYGNAGGILIMYKNENDIIDFINKFDRTQKNCIITNKGLRNIDGNKFTENNIFYELYIDSFYLSNNLIHENTKIMLVKNPNIRGKFVFNIGYSFLKNHIVALDYKNANMYIDIITFIKKRIQEKNELMFDSENYTVNMYNSEHPNYNKINLGDTLKSVNGINIENYFLHVSPCNKDSIYLKIYQKDNLFSFRKTNGFSYTINFN